MTSGEVRATRTLAVLILLGIANHSVLNGSRVIVSLDALSMGASPLTVGVADVAVRVAADAAVRGRGRVSGPHRHALADARSARR